MSEERPYLVDQIISAAVLIHSSLLTEITLAQHPAHNLLNLPLLLFVKERELILRHSELVYKNATEGLPRAKQLHVNQKLMQIVQIQFPITRMQEHHPVAELPETDAAGKEMMEKIQKLQREGLAAAVYTQLTDIEEEVNGLLTYDRKICKLD